MRCASYTSEISNFQIRDLEFQIRDLKKFRNEISAREVFGNRSEYSSYYKGLPPQVDTIKLKEWCNEIVRK